MTHIATLLRSMQFFAHRAHNDVKGPTFFQDHAFLGGLYPVYEEAYDQIIERDIGLGEKPDIAKVTVEAAQSATIKPNTSDAKTLLTVLLKSEESLCKLIKEAVPKATDGTQNLLQGIADASEARQYQMKQRLAA